MYVPSAVAQVTLSSPARSPVIVITTVGAISITGTSNGVETNITNIKIPAGSMGTDGEVELVCLWGYTNSANNKTLVVRYSSTAGSTSGGFFITSTVATTTVGARMVLYISNNHATNAQILSPNSGVTPFAANNAALVALAIDTTADSFINLSGTLALGTETITVQHCTATVKKSPS